MDFSSWELLEVSHRSWPPWKVIPLLLSIRTAITQYRLRCILLSGLRVKGHCIIGRISSRRARERRAIRMSPVKRAIFVTQVTEWENGAARRVGDYLAAEEPLEISVNGQP